MDEGGVCTQTGPRPARPALPAGSSPTQAASSFRLVLRPCPVPTRAGKCSLNEESVAARGAQPGHPYLPPFSLGSPASPKPSLHQGWI